MDSKKIEVSKRKLKKGYNLALLDVTTMKYATKPLGKAIYRANVGRPRKEHKVHWSDRIKCKVCGKEIIRSGRSRHNKTKYHQTYANVGEKLQKILIEN